MRNLRRFRATSWADRRLFFKCYLTVVYVRIVVWLLPFRKWQPLLIGNKPPVEGEQADQKPASAEDCLEFDRVHWAVTAASKRFFKCDTCLIKAISARFALSWKGYSSSVEIGVGQNDQGNFEAHAWTECKFLVVIGDNPDKPIRTAYKHIHTLKASEALDCEQESKIS